MERFYKLAELNSETAQEVKGYWAELFGEEYANSMIKNYRTDAKTKSVKASQSVFKTIKK